LPVHADSAAWVGTIGSTTKFHPDFGTFYEGSPIGIPFITVAGTQPLVGVVFDEPDESDRDRTRSRRPRPWKATRPPTGIDT
jgi:hypothetical protein